jgi:hypothetical protein
VRKVQETSYGRLVSFDWFKPCGSQTENNSSSLNADASTSLGEASTHSESPDGQKEISKDTTSTGYTAKSTYPGRQSSGTPRTAISRRILEEPYKAPSLHEVLQWHIAKCEQCTSAAKLHPVGLGSRSKMCPEYFGIALEFSEYEGAANDLKANPQANPDYWRING